MRTLVLTVMLLLIVSILSCGDEITNIYNDSNNGMVIGNVVPADRGIVQLTGSHDLTTSIDSTGFFILTEIPPGIYTVTVLPDNHSRRKLSSQFIQTGTSLDLRDLKISELPYPIYDTSPSADEEYWPGQGRISLYCDEGLNLDDLSANTTITPPVDGEWVQEYPYDYVVLNRAAVTGYRYSFVFKETVFAGIDYALSINGSVRTLAGEPLGSDVLVPFSATGEVYTLTIPKSTLTGDIDRFSFQVILRVSTCVLTDSVSRTVQFEPEIPGIWVVTNSNQYSCPDGSGRNFVFMATNLPLDLESQYALHFNGTPIGVNRQETIEFSTSGVAVLSVVPGNTETVYSPTTPIYLAFNEPMDTVSVNQAFSLVRLDDTPVGTALTWSTTKIAVMNHTDQPFSRGVYRIAIATTAKSESGVALGKAWESYFMVK